MELSEVVSLINSDQDTLLEILKLRIFWNIGTSWFWELTFTGIQVSGIQLMQPVSEWCLFPAISMLRSTSDSANQILIK